ncbi:uncharacterized protein [Triticum aestivum]|nr:uncharacterized protein LOC123170478 [Triticum aestivum]
MATNNLQTGDASPTEQDPANGSGKPPQKPCADSKLYEFKEQLLLLSTLVATVTYVAGLNLPGGYWEQDDPGGHMAGDPILRDTHYRRYLIFYYCNATALAASLVVSLILIILKRKDHVWTVVLRVVMVLDLLGLMGAYGAGSCRDAFTTIYAGVTFFLLVLIIIAVFFYVSVNGGGGDNSSSKNNTSSHPVSVSIPIYDPKSNPDSNSIPISVSKSNPDSNLNLETKKEEKEKINVLMLLATFVVTITYVAGLNPPGGFWSSTQDRHRLSDPVLQARGRYRGFFVCNTTSFAVSLLIIVLLLERKLLKDKLSQNFTVRFLAPYVWIAVTMLGLMGAYAAGGCREADNTTLVLAVPVGVCLLLWFITYRNGWEQLTTKLHDVSTNFKVLFGIPKGTCEGAKEAHQQNTRYLVMLLATLVVTITYQAGLDPPGGLWLDNQDGHKMSHPVLQMTHPTRYRVFFYSNSAAFVTSLVVIMMLQSKFLLNRHTLEATLVLDLFGLVTAYGAGSTRDVNASFYIIALAGIVLVYVIVHITITDHAPEPEDGAAVLKDLDDKRKVLLLVAILAATLTYQAGLTPPGGFWLADDQGLDRHAGFPVLFNNYPRRYNAFFYCNATSFMASITLILLLVNPKLYRPGIRCYALYVCMLVGMFGLMGAYAAGSARQLKTSIYVLTLVGMVLAFIAFLVFIFWFIIKSEASSKDGQDEAVHSNTDKNIISSSSTTTSINTSVVDAATTTTTIITTTITTTTTSNNINSSSNNNDNQSNSNNTTSSSKDKNEKEKEKETVEYFMLLGILAASMTYQIGLKPPGGLWQDNDNGHSVGNPVLHDINKHRYDVFFYSNSTSFMASIVVIVLLLPWTTSHKRKPPLWLMHMAILLDMLSLLVAYAAGSTRKWETSRNVIFIIIPVLLYIAIYAAASVLFPKEGRTFWTCLTSWWHTRQEISKKPTQLLPQERPV